MEGRTTMRDSWVWGEEGEGTELTMQEACLLPCGRGMRQRSWGDTFVLEEFTGDHRGHEHTLVNLEFGLPQVVQ